MVILRVVLSALALVVMAHGCPTIANYTFLDITNFPVNSFVFTGYSQDVQLSGALKCQLQSECLLTYPIRLLVSLNPQNDIGTTPQTCSATLGLNPPLIVNSLPQGLSELAQISTSMRFVSSRVVKAQVVLWNMENGVADAQFPDFTFDESAPLAATMRSLYTGAGSMATVWSGMGPGQYFNQALNATIYDYKNQFWMMSYSIVVQYAPIITATGANATEVECREFPAELIPQCDRPGYLDANYADPLREFIKFNLPPFPAYIAAGAVASDGLSVPAAVDAAAWRVIDDVRTYGMCTQLFGQCGAIYDKCASNQCVQCTSTDTTICATFNQGGNPSFCDAESRRGITRCNYLQFQTPGPATPVQPTDQSCACENRFCENSICVMCRTGKNSDCELPWSTVFTATCTAQNTCNYVLPAFAPVSKVIDNRQKVAIIAGCVAAGVLLIGVLVVAFCCYKRSQKKTQGDNMMGDSLAKTKKEKRFTFSD